MNPDSATQVFCMVLLILCFSFIVGEMRVITISNDGVVMRNS